MTAVSHSSRCGSKMLAPESQTIHFIYESTVLFSDVSLSDIRMYLWVGLFIIWTAALNLTSSLSQESDIGYPAYSGSEIRGKYMLYHNPQIPNL